MSCKMLCSPHFAHKAPVMQATFIDVSIASIDNFSKTEQSLIFLLSYSRSRTKMGSFTWEFTAFHASLIDSCLLLTSDTGSHVLSCKQTATCSIIIHCCLVRNISSLLFCEVLKLMMVS